MNHLDEALLLSVHFGSSRPEGSYSRASCSGLRPSLTRSEVFLVLFCVSLSRHAALKLSAKTGQLYSLIANEILEGSELLWVIRVLQTVLFLREHLDGRAEQHLPRTITTKSDILQTA